MAGENHEDGVLLALSAVAENLNSNNLVLSKLLHKMDAEDISAIEKAEALEKSAEKAALIKELTASVVKALEASGKLRKEDSKESARKIASNPDKQQEIIQASDDEDEDDKKEDEKDAKQLEMKKEDEEEEDDKEKAEDKEYPEVEKLKKELAEIKKSINDQVEQRMRKAGFVEESNTVPVRRVAMGVGDNTIRKSVSQDDKIGQMAQLSYQQIKQLEMQSEVDELPEEIKQFIS